MKNNVGNGAMRFFAIHNGLPSRTFSQLLWQISCVGEREPCFARLLHVWVRRELRAVSGETDPLANIHLCITDRGDACYSEYPGRR